MCTAMIYDGGSRYFGRNLDIERGYGESVIIVPRGFGLVRGCSSNSHGEARRYRIKAPHLAFIGAGTVIDGYPLMYDGVNEAGVGIAGLNFVGNTHFLPLSLDRLNVAQYEIMPAVLGECGSVDDAIELLKSVNLTSAAFDESIPPAQLHYFLTDRKECAVVEFGAEGARIYDNPAGVLTNNPAFDFQMQNLKYYMNLSSYSPQNGFGEGLGLSADSNGLGAVGMPGDWSSVGRFVRAAFVRANAEAYDEDGSAVMQFFHLLSSVEQVAGCVKTPRGLEKTLYSSCASLATGEYYYKTYEGQSIVRVSLRNVPLDGEELFIYPFSHAMNVRDEN